MVYLISRRVGQAAFIAFAVSAAAPAVHGDDGFNRRQNAYVVTNLVSNIAKLGGKVIDPNLQNPWGVAFTPAASPFWISDNNSGLSTLYDGDGTIAPPSSPLVVTIPCPPPATVGQGSSCPPNPPPNSAAPTGMIWNPTTSTTTGFLVPLTGKVATFIWATEDGTISAWTGGLTPTSVADNAVLAVNNSNFPTTLGAVYKGLVAGVNVNGVSLNGGTDFVLLFATNFRAGTVEAYAPAPSDSTTGFYVPVPPMEALPIRTSHPAMRRSASRTSTAICS
jgi:uncharacterized protein (TIGR03118 family)